MSPRRLAHRFIPMLLLVGMMLVSFVFASPGSSVGAQSENDQEALTHRGVTQCGVERHARTTICEGEGNKGD